MTSQVPHISPAAQGLLSHLKDIHTPAPVSAWPPAPGWFILAALALAAVIGLLWWLVYRWREGRYRREATRELEALLDAYRQGSGAADYLTRYTALLKRTALTRYPRDAIAHLTGEAWVDFLDKSSGTGEFSMGAGQVLIDGNYRPIDETIDVDELHRLGKRWIRHHSRALPAEKTA